MPPCHGGDRRFESGRARQKIKYRLSWRFLFSAVPANRTGTFAVAKAVRRQDSRAEICFEHESQAPRLKAENPVEPAKLTKPRFCAIIKV